MQYRSLPNDRSSLGEQRALFDGRRQVEPRLICRTKLVDVALVIISGSDNHIDAALSAGGDDYLVKPIDFDRLDAILIYYPPTMRNASA